MSSWERIEVGQSRGHGSMSSISLRYCSALSNSAGSWKNSIWIFWDLVVAHLGTARELMMVLQWCSSKIQYGAVQ